MGLVFPVLLGGLVLAGIPVLLHLIMRQKPKTLTFPAFRFLLQRHRTNQRKLRLRHLLLLILRILLIVALALALARPRAYGNVDPDVLWTLQMIFLPITVLVMPAMVAAFLPTTFKRAVLVTLCYVLISMLTYGAILGSLWLMRSAFGV